jgi:hypothetical protein
VLEALAEADFLEHAGGPAVRLAAVHAADDERHGDVLERRELRQQMVELIDEAERRVAHATALGLGHPAERASPHRDRAGTGRVQAAEQVQQGRLARARAPDDHDALTRPDLQVDPRQHAHRRRAEIGLLQAGAGQHGVTHSAAPRPD